MAFDALSGFTDVVSTKDFVNQMATTLVGVKEWALLHDKEVISILKQTYTASNQMKLYDSWAVRASEAVKTYAFETLNTGMIYLKDKKKRWFIIQLVVQECLIMLMQCNIMELLMGIIDIKQCMTKYLVT
jgi:hypothetical protein